jgi:G3E family GTPase
MNNGCICCTVRGDLIRILGQPRARRDKFDHILVETTGSPTRGPSRRPSSSTTRRSASSSALDGIVTLVDAKHVSLHLDDSDEARSRSPSPT